MNQMTRTDDALQRPSYDRSDRFYIENGEWFYLTREQIPIGPYASQQEAEDGLNAYIDYMQVEAE
ncbi:MULTISPECIES: DUF6316 family protein [unclassified Hahella]|uniref:DUF6316 family protein n=1 Tax=unclassified Hahella TaxID=2624107 RepID=UPI000FDD80E8|nr:MULTISPECIES: DUF6316 family protein [unclassified Hahella]AZZ91772.1 hypothetical protein ENC22_11380 [Hahella sp. KA22]MBU6950873.1 hypothetical protein [Hahella sp. HN01]QAY55142.1 hypothetical protein EUZ85_13940 [Hahella sp. KA22]